MATPEDTKEEEEEEENLTNAEFLERYQHAPITDWEICLYKYSFNASGKVAGRKFEIHNNGEYRSGFSVSSGGTLTLSDFDIDEDMFEFY